MCASENFWELFAELNTAIVVLALLRRRNFLCLLHEAKVCRWHPVLLGSPGGVAAGTC
jgi:hypothetical protein